MAKAQQKVITRTIHDAGEMQHLIRYLHGFGTYPAVVRIQPGQEARSIRQNRLQFQWFKDAESQGDQTAGEYRAFCKLHYGVKLLRSADEEFRAVYDSIIRPLGYEQKLALMEPPIDLPVTSRMNVATMTQYLNEVHQLFVNQGFVLTDPALMGMEGWREWR